MEFGLRGRGTSFPSLFVWAAVLFVGASVAMLFSLQFYSAADVDQRDRDRAEEVVSNGIGTYINGAAQKALPQAYWDDAVVHLDHRMDHAWAAEFLGNYLKSTTGIDAVAVFDRDDRLAFAYAGGREVAPPVLAGWTTQARRLLTDVRLAEVRRGPLPPLPIPANARLSTILAHEIVQDEGHLILLSATLVQPDDVALPKTARAPIILTAETLNTRLTEELGNQFLLDRPTLVIGERKTPEEIAHVAIRDRDGEILATLQWRASRPGSELLRRTLGATTGFSILLGLMVSAFVLRGRRLARALVESEAEAARLAYRDSLTGLANRAQFERAVAGMRGKAAAGRFALLSIDLDHFKSVNDSHGHAAGDQLICLVADLLRSCCTPAEALIRFGGDEFVMLQPGGDEANAAALAERIAARLHDPVQIAGTRVFVGASIGIVLADRHQSATEWLRRADLALYAAKSRGRAQFAFYEPAMDDGVRERHELHTRLHEAIKEQRLELAYQPQVGRNGEVIGLEALARWMEPDLGPIAPARFVELAEQGGMIDALGRFALRQAFVDSRRWPGVRVAVNVSSLQLRQRDFAGKVAELARECEVNAAQFDLEITESVLLGEDSHVLGALRELRKLGFRIVLDDFGTGYSNLGALQLYPIDKIKIDKSFVARIGHDANAEALIIALVRLARALSLDVIAEGVETDAQRLCLSVAGCPDVQGFLTGRPMPADEAEALIASERGPAIAAS